MNEEKVFDMKAKEINLLNADARFSLASLGEGWYHFNGLQEVKIIDIPEEKVKSYEELTLEV